MEYVLKIKDENGNWLTIPAIKGASNYELAVANGYNGTEAEWIELLKPTAKVTKVEDGYFVEIKDAYGTVSFTVRDGKDGKTITKVSELENDEGYLKSQGEAANIGYGADGEVSIGASAGVNIGSGGSVTIVGNNAAVIKSYSDVAATFNGQRISNIAKPVSDDDAVTLRYLLDMGYIQRGANDSIDLSALETKIGGGSFVVDPLAYGMSVSGNRIQNVGTPEADTDGANKKYVDDAVKGIDIPDVSVPTKVSQLENDAGYITNFVDEMNVTGTLHTQIIYGHEGIDINSEHTFIGSIDGVGIDFGGYNTDRNYGQIEGDMRVQTPENDQSIANKKYVDDLIGDVGTALDNIIALQNAKIEG